MPDLAPVPPPSSSSPPTSLPLPSQAASAPAWLLVLGGITNRAFSIVMALVITALLHLHWHEMEKLERILMLSAIVAFALAADNLASLAKAVAKPIAAWRGTKDPS